MSGYLHGGFNIDCAHKSIFCDSQRNLDERSIPDVTGRFGYLGAKLFSQTILPLPVVVRVSIAEAAADDFYGR